MKRISDIDEMIRTCAAIRSEGKSIGLVPTMGALHDGHRSLLKIARGRCDILVTSIFVNPSQFGPNEDLAKYPRQIGKDCALCEAEGVDIVFMPLPNEMYVEDYSTWIKVDDVSAPLEGERRPGHFIGVATVVLKFFNIVTPNFAVFGQKDAQQLAVIRRMVRDLNVPVEIIAAPIVREEDGLAMSSRNIYLSTSERKSAPAIFRGLRAASRLFANGEFDASILCRRVRHELSSFEKLAIEYVSLADSLTMREQVNAGDGSLISIAVRTPESGTRLIDNVILGEIK